MLRAPWVLLVRNPLSTLGVFMSGDGRSDDAGLTGLRGMIRLSVSADTCFVPYRGESGFLAKLAWEGAVDRLDTYLNLTHVLGC